MPNQARPEEEYTGFSPSWGSAIRGIIVFGVCQYMISQFASSGTSDSTPAAKSDVSSFDARPIAPDGSTHINPIPQALSPIWPLDTPLDISIYVSPSPALPPLASSGSVTQVMEEKKFRIGDWKDKRQVDASFDVPPEVQNNGTLWAHFFVAVSGHPLHPSDEAYDGGKAYTFSRPLTQHLLKKKVAKTKKLLGGSDDKNDEADEDPQPKGRVVASYYHPNFTVSVIPDSGTLNFPTLHPAVRQFLNLESSGARDASGENGWYYPILFINTFWQLRDHMTELNSTVKRLPLHIDLNNLNNWKFSMFSSIDEGMKQTQAKAAAGGPMPAGGDGSEFEMFKSILLDTNIYLLATTGVVTVLHMIFEMLAFKNDISHWKNKKDNVGVSVRTILANVFMQAIILLYLIDNSEGTSYVILMGQGFGILLEAWKITKTVDVRVRPAAAGAWLPYRVTFEDKHKLSETEEKTKEYDEIAFRYLYMVAVPLLGAYAAYSVLYETHKSWYSFVITTLVGSVYAYGFLMMSVAHMPAKAMTYKFLNTFIDDLFAFTIKMPTLHRLATLRDDVIFFIYLYQGYKYKVDYTRVNEFGQGGDEADEKKAKEAKTAAGPLAGAAEAKAKKGSEARGSAVEVEGAGEGEGEGVKKRR
ncbi:MAG: hypothetical protein M1832_003068 [Thelocarpon impressellum]|nr:MAG: hypothetical protein M1832_003068 [Thelocarpon impressellum]